MTGSNEGMRGAYTKISWYNFCRLVVGKHSAETVNILHTS